MGARHGLSQKKNPGWYPEHFLGAKTKIENWVRGTSVCFENPVDLAINHYLSCRRKASTLCWKQPSTFAAARQNTKKTRVAKCRIHCYQFRGRGNEPSDSKRWFQRQSHASIKDKALHKAEYFSLPASNINQYATIPILYWSIWPQGQ